MALSTALTLTSTARNVRSHVQGDTVLRVLINERAVLGTVLYSANTAIFSQIN